MDNGNELRIGKGTVDFIRVIPFPKACRRAVGDALPAEGAVRVLDDAVMGYIDRGP